MDNWNESYIKGYIKGGWGNKVGFDYGVGQWRGGGNTLPLYL
tara:strand:- start:1122 stop:1247 length:126 start_codon:yes stop_codon:yes gene_type:complete